jgi:hypothetical protein
LQIRTNFLYCSTWNGCYIKGGCSTWNTLFNTIIQDSRFKIQNDATERYSTYLSVVVFENYGNVAIKREQRLLADYAEREQRKDCEAGLIMGERGKMKTEN